MTLKRLLILYYGSFCLILYSFSTLDRILSGGYLCFTIRQNSVLYKMVFLCVFFFNLAEVADKGILFHLIYLIYLSKLWDKWFVKTKLSEELRLVRKKYVFYNMLMILFFFILGQKKKFEICTWPSFSVLKIVRHKAKY